MNFSRDGRGAEGGVSVENRKRMAEAAAARCVDGVVSVMAKNAATTWFPIC